MSSSVYTPLDESVAQRLSPVDLEPDAVSHVSMKSRKAKIHPDLRAPLARDIEANDDPFYVFREDLYRKLDLVDAGIDEVDRIINQSEGSFNLQAFKNAKKQLKRHLRNAEATIKDVQTTVSLVEKQRDKFAHIDNSELYERNSLLKASKDRIALVKSQLNDADATKQKLVLEEKRNVVKASMENNNNNNNSSASAEAENFIADSHAQSSLLMEEQDETLDELGEAVLRVGEMATGINEEIERQNKMLEEMDDDLADAEEKLGLVMGKLAKFLKTKNKWQLCTILTLCGVVVILFFLVIYT